MSAEDYMPYDLGLEGFAWGLEQGCRRAPCSDRKSYCRACGAPITWGHAEGGWFPISGGARHQCDPALDFEATT